MSSMRTLQTRIIQKHALEVDWLKAVNFVPLRGESIVYDAEVDEAGNTLALPEGRSTPYPFSRLKIGDGFTNVNRLPFVSSWTSLEACEEEVVFSCGTAAPYIPEPPAERLEGDGQEFYTAAPSNLTFRSTAPLSELQDIQINGETVDPSNYTLEEGSTIVKLSHEYLKTLDVGNYELSVVSDSKTVKGGFTVVAPELNEYGFYYNQPYYTEITGATFLNVAIVFSSDKTAIVLDLDNSEVQTMEYQHNQEEITFTIPLTDFFVGGSSFQGKFSQDGTALSGILDMGMFGGGEKDTIFETGHAIFSDRMYIYYLPSWGSYEDRLAYFPIDRTLPVYSVAKDNILGIPVEVIGHQAFLNNELLTEINLPRTIKLIADEAFCNCSSFTSITLPDGVAEIANGAFSGCTNLTSIIFEGTIAQWNAIIKRAAWNTDVPATYVQCSDGQVAL